MKLLPLDRPELIELAAYWLGQKENYQWLDFGNGRQIITPALLRIMSQRDTHEIRIYTASRDDTPIGIVALHNVDRAFRTATLWGAAGDKSLRYWGSGTIAGSMMLTHAFRDLHLNTVNTWVVECNPSLRTVERMGFRYIGRQRQCHCIDGKPYDRLLFDLMASEHREIDDAILRRHVRRPESAKRGDADVSMIGMNSGAAGSMAQPLQPR
jgi:RimJ/RimL family protein N-acetyltransferase